MRGCSCPSMRILLSSPVFPAGAGVFPCPLPLIPGRERVPRRCGGVPIISSWDKCKCMCSPQVRGCSRFTEDVRASEIVFPAGAGVFPSQSSYSKISSSVPRRCGGVPCDPSKNDVEFWCSPQVRGCSFAVKHFPFVFNVFPAGAGVFPDQRGLVLFVSCVPRRCGGVPLLEYGEADEIECSPA